MHLVDDIYLIFALNRRVLYLLPDLPDVVHTVVGSGVNLKDIQRTLIVDGLTGRTLVARIAIHRMLAVDRLGKKLRDGCLAGSTRATEKIRVPDSVIKNLIAQGADDGILPLNLIKIVRAPFSI